MTKYDARHRYKVTYKNHRNEVVEASFVYHFEAVQFADSCGFRFISLGPTASYLEEMNPEDRKYWEKN